jgi:hypothetical protein
MTIVIQRRNWIASAMNSNNHPKGPEVLHLDYKTEIRRTNVSAWKDMIRYPVQFEWTFEPNEICVMKESMQVSLISNKLSSLHEEELTACIERLQKQMPEISDGWFVRFDEASPKDGVRALPLYTAHQIIEQIVTSMRALRALEEGNRVLYFCPYQPDWNSEKELRVFVYNSRVTAISQYATKTKLFPAMSDEKLTAVAKSVTNFLDQHVSQYTSRLGTQFVCDIYFDIEPRVIEFNSFGYWLASGSGYFHWLTDKEILYGDGETVVFRIDSGEPQI